MSNFKCSECGMINIDCGKEGYKTPREIELETVVIEVENRLKTLDEEAVTYQLTEKTNYERIKNITTIKEMSNFLKKNCSKILVLKISSEYTKEDLVEQWLQLESL